MLEDSKINIKIKLAALWTAVMFCYVYGDYFEFYVPDKVNDLLTGDNILNSPAKLFMASILLAIPALMIALNVLVSAKTSRVLNIIFGALYTLLMVFIGVNSLTSWYSFYVFYAFLESLLTATIVWLAIKWPRV